MIIVKTITSIKITGQINLVHHQQPQHSPIKYNYKTINKADYINWNKNKINGINNSLMVSKIFANN
jgi:hypothetical protein